MLLAEGPVANICDIKTATIASGIAIAMKTAVIAAAHGQAKGMNHIIMILAAKAMRMIITSCKIAPISALRVI